MAVGTEKCYITDFENGEKGTCAKECEQPLETRKKQGNGVVPRASSRNAARLTL